MQLEEQKVSNTDYPALYLAADSASSEAQGTYTRYISSVLVLLVAAAAVSLFSGDSQCLAIISALLFVGTFTLSILLAVKRYDKTWYNGRAVAESIKTRT